MTPRICGQTVIIETFAGRHSLADGRTVGQGYIGLILRDTLIHDRLTAEGADGCYKAVTIVGPFGSSY